MSSATSAGRKSCHGLALFHDLRAGAGSRTSRALVTGYVRANLSDPPQTRQDGAFPRRTARPEQQPLHPRRRRRTPAVRSPDDAAVGHRGRAFRAGMGRPAPRPTSPAFGVRNCCRPGISSWKRTRSASVTCSPSSSRPRRDHSHVGTGPERMLEALSVFDRQGIRDELQERREIFRATLDSSSAEELKRPNRLRA